MAHTLSALKRQRQNAARNERNKAVKSHVKTQIRKVKDAVQKIQEAAAKSKSSAQEADIKKIQADYHLACKLLDKAVAKGVLHLNNASRHKSRLAAKVASLAKKN